MVSKLGAGLVGLLMLGAGDLASSPIRGGLTPINPSGRFSSGDVLKTPTLPNDSLFQANGASPNTGFPKWSTHAEDEYGRWMTFCYNPYGRYNELKIGANDTIINKNGVQVSVDWESSGDTFVIEGRGEIIHNYAIITHRKFQEHDFKVHVGYSKGYNEATLAIIANGKKLLKEVYFLPGDTSPQRVSVCPRECGLSRNPEDELRVVLTSPQMALKSAAEIWSDYQAVLPSDGSLFAMVFRGDQPIKSIQIPSEDGSGFKHEIIDE